LDKGDTLMENQATRPTVSKWLLVAVHLGSILPLALFGLAALRGRLGFNPVETAMRHSGRAAVTLLLLSLAVTPLRKIFNLPILTRLRKPLGLYAALYACLHFAAFALWDYGLNLGLIWLEFSQKPFLTLGLISLLILALLAATSTRDARRRMRSGWRWLQRGVYLAAVLAVAHQFMAVKGDLSTLQGDYTLPLIAGGALLLLFLLRIPPIYQTLQRWLGRV
jgi:methionine sulfoxide reductase heme-binding subunit